MEIVLHRLDAAGIDGFARLVRPVLHADPVRHTVALSVLEGLCAGDTAAAGAAGESAASSTGGVGDREETGMGRVASGGYSSSPTLPVA